MIVVFFFFIIMPQRKKIKQEKEFQESIKPGNKIVTIGGLHGKISEVHDTTVVIETMSGKLKIEKSAISPEKSLKANAPDSEKK